MKTSLIMSLLLGTCTIVLFQNCAANLPDSVVNSASLAAKSCTLNGMTLTSGSSTTGYSAPSASTEAACQALAQVVTCTNGVTSTTVNYSSCVVAGPTQSIVVLQILASTSNYNIATSAGTLPENAVINLTIANGVTVGSSSTGAAALKTGTFPSGTIVNITNNGLIAGAGGAGAAAGTLVDTGGAIVGFQNAGTGGNGGPALELDYPVTITNPGVIGGGGGGGGGGAACGDESTSIAWGSGGGGGGAGSVGGAGGPGGGVISPSYMGTPGAAGTATAGGVGGTTNGAAYYSNLCNNGGTGGSLGAVGGVGADVGTLTSTGAIPGPGGQPGPAIVDNGNSITWISGEAAPNRLGSIQ